MSKPSVPLHQSVYDYYCTHFEELSFWKKIHFATRLAHWDNDIFCHDNLAKMRLDTIGEIDVETTLKQLYYRYKDTPPKSPKNAAELRLPYFEKYPELRTINIVLFRALVYMQSYNIDCRSYIDQLFPHDKIGKFLTKLFQDEAAVSILSTHALNAQYLYRRLVQQSDDTPDFSPYVMYEIGKNSYTLSDKTHLKLYIYFYTHCIIGESLFYTRQIPKHLREIYTTMLRDLEDVIDEHFIDINLDNKCEFLVCCQILDLPTRIRSRIEHECQNSVSDQGMYLIDRHNTNPQIDSSDFNKSEHRNVLYIMSNRTYRPQDKN